MTIKISKRLVATVAVAMFIIASSTLVRADDTDIANSSTTAPGNSRQLRNQNIVEKLSNRLENRELAATERRERLSEKRQVRIRAFAEQMQKRLQAAIVRLEHLSSRIAEAINRFEQRGASVEEAKNYLRVAQNSITEAKVATTEYQNKVAAMIESEDPHTAFQGVRRAGSEAVAEIRAAHRQLVSALQSLKSLPQSDNETAPTN